MADEKLIRLQAFLSKHDASLEILPKARVKQLKKADEAIQKRFTATKEAKKTLKSSSINVSTIAADTGISRKTFYNNVLLRLYVELYSTSESEDSVSSDDFKRLKDKNTELVRQIQDFLFRDIATENIRHENLKLTREVKNRDAQIYYLQEQYEKSQIELLQIKKTLLSLPGHIIQFNPNNK